RGRRLPGGGAGAPHTAQASERLARRARAGPHHRADLQRGRRRAPRLRVRLLAVGVEQRPPSDRRQPPRPDGPAGGRLAAWTVRALPLGSADRRGVADIGTGRRTGTGGGLVATKDVQYQTGRPGEGRDRRGRSLVAGERDGRDGAGPGG